MDQHVRNHQRNRSQQDPQKVHKGALKNKGLVKINNFKKKENKLNYLQYVITTKGISEKT